MNYRIHRDMLDVQVYSLIGKQKYEELYQENIELLQTIEDIERLIKHLYDQKKNKCWIIALGFAIVILVGTFLLLLPVSSDHTDFLDALFTATSATCVTGLVVYDTATHWTLFGQIVILLLIKLVV